jgi:hypothetical protein
MTNELADLLLTTLSVFTSRAYRNKSVDNPTHPYIVYKTSDVNDTYPTEDVLVQIRIFDKNDGTVSVRTIESLADSIDTVLNHNTLPTTNYQMFFTRDIREHDNDPSLAGVQVINLQYTVRVYSK